MYFQSPARRRVKPFLWDTTRVRKNFRYVVHESVHAVVTCMYLRAPICWRQCVHTFSRRHSQWDEEAQRWIRTFPEVPLFKSKQLGKPKAKNPPPKRSTACVSYVHMSACPGTAPDSLVPVCSNSPLSDTHGFLPAPAALQVCPRGLLVLDTSVLTMGEARCVNDSFVHMPDAWKTIARTNLNFSANLFARACARTHVAGSRRRHPKIWPFGDAGPVYAQSPHRKHALTM